MEIGSVSRPVGTSVVAPGEGGALSFEENGVKPPGVGEVLDQGNTAPLPPKSREVAPARRQPAPARDPEEATTVFEAPPSVSLSDEEVRRLEFRMIEAAELARRSAASSGTTIKIRPPEVKRALPVAADAPRTPMDFVLWQIALERRHFSCGTIDGDFGMRSRRALRAFQERERLPVTGELDFETRLALGLPGDPWKDLLVTPELLAEVQPTPSTWMEKASRSFLGYNDPWEMLAEKVHSTPKFLRSLNPEIGEIRAGMWVRVPNLDPSIPLVKASRIEVRLRERTLLVYDQAGRVTACFPCSIARDKNKRPEGVLLVKNFALNPNYTFSPSNMPDIAAAEGISRRLILAPGPNNPVGLAWIGLSLPGYGIHGTPDPSAISRTGSLGCFRLANWNAVKLLHMIEIGTPVEVIP